jgi:hypothetical protein
MDWKAEGWTGKQKDGLEGMRMDRQSGRLDRYSGGWIDSQENGQKVRRIDRQSGEWTDSQEDGQSVGLTDGQEDGQSVGWTDGQEDGLTCRGMGRHSASQED